MLYIELFAKWQEFMNGQNGTFDMDIVESLHGIVSRIRAARSMISIMNLENFCLSKKNKIFEFVYGYLQTAYPEIYNLIHQHTLNEYKITKHIKQENEKRKAVNKGILKYYTDRVGIVEEKRNINLSQPSKKANKANLNTTKQRQRPPQTRAARATQIKENKRNKQIQKELAIVKKVRNRNKNRKKQKKKRLVIQDLLDMVDMENTIDDYINFVDEVMKKKDNMDNDMDIDSDVDDEDEDMQLIQDCFDMLSDSDSDDSDSDDSD